MGCLAWEHAFEWVKFSIQEISPGQMLPSDWNLWTEFIYKSSKQYGWFQFPKGESEFMPESRESWVQSSNPQILDGSPVYYNAKAKTNGVHLFDYSKPVRPKIKM